MGAYLNPEGQRKEVWLKRNAEGSGTSTAPTLEEAFGDKGTLFVCFINEGTHTVGAIIYDPNELRHFTSPRDRRIKLWYRVKKHTLLQPNISNLARYVKVVSA